LSHQNTEDKMKNFLTLCFISLFCLAAGAQNSTCATPAPFCTTVEYNFPAGVDAGSAEVGPDYGCLGSEPNPAWYFMQVQNSGDMNINMIGSADGVNPSNDIDFICYGPFTTLVGACDNLTAANTVDCSYSSSAIEDVNITGAVEGEYYILLITNFSNTPCNILFSQTGGFGSTNCLIVNPVCEGDSVVLDSGLDPDSYVFSWAGPNGFVSSEATPVFYDVTLDLSGEYILIAINFEDTAVVNVEVDVQPRPDSSGFLVSGIPCIGNTITLTSDSTYVGATYTWTLPNGTEANTNPLILTDISSSLSEGVTLEITLNGCTSIPVTELIEIAAPIVPVISGALHYCFLDSTTLQTQGGFDTYTWSQPGNEDSLLAGAGVVTVTTVDSNGCISTSSPVTVTNSSPEVEVSGIEPFCEADSLLLSANEGVAPWNFQYYWVSGADTLSTVDSLYHHGGELSLYVQDDAGCRDSIIIDAPPTDLPTAAFTSDPQLNTALVNTPFIFTDATTPTQGDPIADWNWSIVPPLDTLFFDTQNINYIWASPDTGNKVVQLIVTSALGCQDTTIYLLYIIDKPFVPNVINPESEVTMNKSLKIPFLDQWPGNNVVIFNRWGKKVFEASNYTNNWNGDNLPAGTYFYVVSAPNLEPLKGSITLLRN